MAPDLLITQKDQVFEAVHAAGMDPAEFEWVKRRGWYTQSSAPCLRHRPTGYYFVFDFGSTGVGVEYAPADDAPFLKDSLGDWVRVRLHVVIWTRALNREYSAPNLWEQLTRHRELFSAEGAEDENEPFTLQELARVDATLDELRELVQAANKLSPEQVDAVDRRVGYLRAAARRVGRIDWLNLALSAVVQLVFQAVLTSDAAQEVMSFIQRSLGDLFVHLRGLPRPPT